MCMCMCMCLRIFLDLHANDPLRGVEFPESMRRPCRSAKGVSPSDKRASDTGLRVFRRNGRSLLWQDMCVSCFEGTLSACNFLEGPNANLPAFRIVIVREPAQLGWQPPKSRQFYRPSFLTGIRFRGLAHLDNETTNSTW